MEKTSSSIVSNDIRFNLDMFFDELKEINIDYVGHGVINNKGEHTGYFSQKTWGSYYLEKGYFYHDPILEVYDQNPVKIINWINVEENINNKEILCYRTQHTGIVQGVTAVTKFKNHLEFLSLGFKKELDLNNYLIDNHLILKNYMQVFRHYHTYQRVLKVL